MTSKATYRRDEALFPPCILLYLFSRLKGSFPIPSTFCMIFVRSPSQEHFACKQTKAHQNMQMWNACFLFSVHVLMFTFVFLYVSFIIRVVFLRPFINAGIFEGQSKK